MDPKNFRNSITVRLIIIGVLILILLIPSALITGIVSEREHRKTEAIAELTSKWARAQTIGGPVITVPYEETWKDDQGKTKTSIQYLQILPESLVVDGTLKPEIRYRGIYKAVLYNAKLDLKGSFSFAKLDSLNL
ncbi:MAG TPA: inner membrane CreD family protein, partial [Bacillota bacterium]|nr:inner membrane CreD family protein [Bacillota bacterium]